MDTDKLRFDQYNFNYTAQVSLRSAPACGNCIINVSIRGFNSRDGHGAADLTDLLASDIPWLVFDATNWNVTQEISLSRSRTSINEKIWFLEAWVFDADERSGYARKRSNRVLVQFEQLESTKKSSLDKLIVSNASMRPLCMHCVRVSATALHALCESVGDRFACTV